jgi:exopolysaccharide production repressor protein
MLGWVCRCFLLGPVDWPSGMSLPNFIIGMIFALAIVVAWCYLDGASPGTTMVRVIVCAVIIQVGYFLLVYLMIARGVPTSADKQREPERTLSADKAEEGEKFSTRRIIH